jgi:hypothetical protein
MNLCCAIHEADTQGTGYPQWVVKALKKSGGRIETCERCTALGDDFARQPQRS